MNVKRSVALVIRNDARPGSILLVRRPDDDEHLPGVWGLPAASLLQGEDEDGAARRAARDKLGLVIEPGRVLNEGVLQRPDHRLVMTLRDATITNGSPRLDLSVDDGTTRYQEWRWGPLDALRPAAEQGSLCSRLALEAL